MTRMIAFCNKCGVHYDAAQPHTCKPADLAEHRRLLDEWSEVEAEGETAWVFKCERCGRLIDVDGGEVVHSLDTAEGYLDVCTACLAEAWGLTVEELENNEED